MLVATLCTSLGGRLPHLKGCEGSATSSFHLWKSKLLSRFTRDTVPSSMQKKDKIMIESSVVHHVSPFVAKMNRFTNQSPMPFTQKQCHDSNPNKSRRYSVSVTAEFQANRPCFLISSSPTLISDRSSRPPILYR